MKQKLSTLLIFSIFLMNPFWCHAGTVILTNASPNVTINAGENTVVYGTAAANNVTIASTAHVELINFPGSNTIDIQSNSNLFVVSRSGATAIFEGSDGTYLKIPATTSTQSVVFTDLFYELVIDAGNVYLGGQLITLTPSLLSDAPSSVCGNGLLESGEECDDENTADGDGCSANCSVEAGADADTDNDGVPDVDEMPLTQDTDNDGTPDYLDSDDDDDGVPTINELPATNDLDMDGQPDYLDAINFDGGFPSPRELEVIAPGYRITCDRTETPSDDVYIGITYKTVCKMVDGYYPSGREFLRYSESNFNIYITLENFDDGKTSSFEFTKSYTNYIPNEGYCQGGRIGAISVNSGETRLKCSLDHIYELGCQGDAGQFAYQLWGSVVLKTYVKTQCFKTKPTDDLGNCLVDINPYSFAIPALNECRGDIEAALPNSMVHLLVNGSCHQWWDYTDKDDVRHECSY